MPSSLTAHTFTGYQISVVPKAIPGFGLLPLTEQEDEQEGNEEAVSSVSAVVDKEQQTFVVRQLRPSVRYIFQIQTVSEQWHGPPNSLEFEIESQDFSSLRAPSQSYASHQEQQKMLQLRLKDALRASSNQERSPVESTSQQPSFLNNAAARLHATFASLLVKSVLWACLGRFLIETRCKT